MERYLGLILLAGWLSLAAAAAQPAAAQPAAGPTRGDDGSYRFSNDLYTALIDPQGRLSSLQVQGQELLAQPDVNPRAVGACFDGGPDSRTFLPLPNLTLEAGMVVARGQGLEVSYRFRPDGLDFLFDVTTQLPWAFHLQRGAITHLARPDGGVVPLGEGGLTAKALTCHGYNLVFTPTLYTHYNWLGAVGAPDMVSGAYLWARPGKSELSLRLEKNSGWTMYLELASLTPTRANHLFPAGEPVRFDLKLRNHADRDFAGTLAAVVEDHAGFVPTRTSTLPVQVPARGEATVTWQVACDQPLVSRTHLHLKTGEETILTRDLVFVCDAEHYRPPLTRPPDFATFWEATLRDMRDRPLDLQLTPAPQFSNAHKTVSLVSFTGLGGRRIEGWLVEPTAPGKYWASFGARVRNYEWPAPSPEETTDSVALVMKLYEDGLYRSGMGSRDTAEFRHVYADHVRCVDVLLTREKVDPRRLVAMGASRTGPSAFAAAALDPRVALVNIHVPTSAGISWPTNFYHGWGAPGMCGVPEGLTRAQWNEQVLAYFDMVNFAPAVKCPVIIGLGLRDYDLSPAPGIIAAYGYLTGDRALGVSPWEGHCYPKVFQDLEVAYRAKYLQPQ